MGVAYSYSNEEERKLKKIYNGKKYHTFHVSFIDENRKKNVDGSVKQLIFGSDKLEEKSYNNLFLQSTSNFGYSLDKVQHLIDLYPIFYELYEKHNVENFMKVLEIDKVEQIDDILKKLLNGATFVYEPKTTLEKLHNIASLRQSKKFLELAKKTGKNRFSNTPMTSLDALQLQSVKDGLYLSEKPEFLNEMILVYIITIFKEYLKSVLEKIFFICPELKIEPNQQISIPDKFSKILKLFKNNLNYDLEEQISEWNLIKEMRNRRNRLIHYKGIPDKNYNDDTGHVGFDRLITDIEYVKNSLKTIRKNQGIINSYLYEEYVYEKFIKQMSSEDTLD